MDYFAGTEAYEGIYQNNMVAFKLIQPFLLRAGVTTQKEVDQLYEQMFFEMRIGLPAHGLGQETGSGALAFLIRCLH